MDFFPAGKINLFRIRLFYSLASPIHPFIFAVENLRGRVGGVGLSNIFILNPLQKSYVTEVAKLCKKSMDN